MEKLNKIFYIAYNNQEFKVLFRCRQCKFSVHEGVAMWRSYGHRATELSKLSAEILHTGMLSAAGILVSRNDYAKNQKKIYRTILLGRKNLWTTSKKICT